MYPYSDDERENDEAETALNRMVEDRLYWQEQDPEFRDYVSDSFKSVYSDEPAEADATGRTVAPAPRAVALPPFRPSVTPDDTALAGGVGENQPNTWRDVLKVQKGLANTDHYKFDLANERSGEHSPSLAQAIRDFQREKKEEIDGILLPGGPTITRMRESLFGESTTSTPEPRLADGPAGNANLQALPQIPDAAIRGREERDDARVIPAQARDPQPPPSGAGHRRTHREAEREGERRSYTYQIIDTPTRPKFPTAPYVFESGERRTSILNDTPARISVAEAPYARSAVPRHAFHPLGWYAVHKHSGAIDREAARIGVDPDLIRAIMYVENAQGGHYGLLAEMHGIAKSVLPMNIRPNHWSGLGFSRRDFDNPELNIRAAAKLIRRIQDRLDHATISKVATLYNSLSQDSVTDYGARVAEVYRTKAWR